MASKRSSALSTLFDFLNQRRCSKEDTTHVSQVDPKGKFCITTDQDKKVFNILYSNAVKVGCDLGIAEKPRKNSPTPLRVDCDFKLPITKYGVKSDPIDLKIIEKLVYFYQTAISEIVDEKSYFPEMTYCVLLQKKTRYRVDENNKENVKTGFHLHFPFFICRSWVQDVLIREKVISYVKEVHLFSRITFNNNIEDVFDKTSSLPWLMYGSKKSVYAQSYEVSRCYDSLMNVIELEDIFQDQLDDINTGRKRQRTKVGYDLPQLLSISSSVDEAKLKSVFEKKFNAASTKKPRRKRVPVKKTEEEIQKDLHFIEETGLLNMLSDQRAEDRNLWIDVGWTMFCIGEGTDKALDMWMEFSSRSNKYDPDVCIKEWDIMENRGKTIASLKRMAQVDSPDEYNEWRRIYVKNFLDEAISVVRSRGVYTAHYKIAKVLKEMFDNLVCSNSKNNTWYRYVNHRWQELDDGVDVKKMLVEDVSRKFYDYKYEIMGRIREINYNAVGGTEEQSKEIEEMKAKMTKIDKITDGLSNTGFVNGVVSAAKTLFYEKNFCDKLDNNKSLWGCENGVYDLDAGLFREGRPDDYVSKNCGLCWYRYERDDVEVEELQEFLSKIFPDRELYEYTMKAVSSCLKGGNRDKRFYILTGEGNNGKSVFVKLIENTFSNKKDGYCWKFPTELLLRNAGKNSSGSARPELAGVKGCRIGFFDEITKDKQLDVDILKKMTGNDSFFARFLNKNGGPVVPMFTLWLQCNALPAIPAHDQPTWNRTRVIDCEATFVSNPPKDPKERRKKKLFKASKNIDEKIQELASVFLWYLTEYHKKYRKYGIQEPDKVKAATSKYQENNDVYVQYMNECLKKTGDPENFIRISEMYEDFKVWFEDNYPEYNNNKDKIGQKTLREELTRRLKTKVTKKTKNLGWEGWALVSSLQDEDDFVEE